MAAGTASTTLTGDAVGMTRVIRKPALSSVREAVARPVVDVEPDGGNAADDVNAGEAGLQVGGRLVAVYPVEEQLNRAGDEIGSEVSADRGVRMERRGHLRASARLSGVDVALDGADDRVGCGDRGVLLLSS